jgi:hypothetical protein
VWTPACACRCYAPRRRVSENKHSDRDRKMTYLQGERSFRRGGGEEGRFVNSDSRRRGGAGGGGG